MDKGLRNILLLGVAFMLFLSAGLTMSNIQKTVTDSISKDDPSYHADGYYSQATTSVFFAVFIWSTPSMISLIGTKLSMCLGTIISILFILQFLIPKIWSMYLLSAAYGFGLAILWTAQGSYLTLTSTKETITRNAGIFSTLSQISIIIGNIFVTFAFNGKEEIDSRTRFFVILTLAGICTAGLLAFILLPKIEKGEREVESVKPEGPVQAFLEAVKLLFTTKMLLLTVVCFYEGLEFGFYSGIYSSCLGFTKKFANRKELIGISGVFVGFGEVFGCGVFGIFGQKVVKMGRSIVIATGCFIHATAFCLIFVNLPNDSTFSDTDEDAIINSNPIVAILCSFFLGLGDSIYNNMVTSFLGTVYANNSAAAFAIFQCFLGIGSITSFITAQSLGLYYQLSILLIMAVIGTLCFARAEFLYNKQNCIFLDNKEKSDKLSPDPKLQLEKF